MSRRLSNSTPNKSFRVDINNSDSDEYEYVMVPKGSSKQASKQPTVKKEVLSVQPMNTLSVGEIQYAKLKQAETTKPSESKGRKSSASKFKTPPPVLKKEHGYSDDDTKDILFQLYSGWSVTQIGDEMHSRGMSSLFY
jgi:hypothetical protein